MLLHLSWQSKVNRSGSFWTTCTQNDPFVLLLPAVISIESSLLFYKIYLRDPYICCPNIMEIGTAAFEISRLKVLQHTRPRSVAAGNRHSHATLGIMGNHRKVVLYHNNVNFTATRGQRVKAPSLARTLMRNPMNINKNDCHYPTLLAFVPNILRSHMTVWLSFWKNHNPMFLISPVQPWWCQYMTISTLLDICVLTGFPRKGFVMRNLDVYLNVRRKKC